MLGLSNSFNRQHSCDRKVHMRVINENEILSVTGGGEAATAACRAMYTGTSAAIGNAMGGVFGAVIGGGLGAWLGFTFCNLH